MKNVKERKFIRKVNDIYKQEVNISKCIILESGSANGEIDYVLYEDRFGRQWQVRKTGDNYSIGVYRK